MELENLYLVLDIVRVHFGENFSSVGESVGNAVWLETIVLISEDDTELSFDGLKTKDVYIDVTEIEDFFN